MYTQGDIVPDMTHPAASRRRNRDVVLNLRATAGVRDLIDRAAASLGQSRSEFMLESARARAEHVLLDRKLFVLDDEQYASFQALLDSSPKPSKTLRTLLSRKALWEQ
jgi:uncharacterized protein (DUF1778 family)